MSEWVRRSLREAREAEPERDPRRRSMGDPRTLPLVAGAPISSPGSLSPVLSTPDPPMPGLPLEPGRTASRSLTVTADHVEAYAEITEVLSVHEAKPVCRLAVSVVRQDGEEVLKGEAWCYRFMPGNGG